MRTPALVGVRTSGLPAGGESAAVDRWRTDGGATAVFVATLTAAGYAATPHPQYYANTILGAPVPSVDVLEPLLAQAVDRELDVYSDLAEATAHDRARRTPSWVELLEVDLFGRRGQRPCFRNPDYRNWWLSVVEDQVKSYPLAGVSFTLDRPTPLSSALRGDAPVCFCTFCSAQAARQQVDVDRAREGYRQLLAPAGLRTDAVAGGENPAVVLFRVLLRFPEVVAWESLWVQGYLGLQQQLFGAVKAISSRVAVGWQIPDQYASSPLYRAHDSLAERRRYSDFLCHTSLRRPAVETALLGVSARTADAFAADVLGDVVSLVGADTGQGCITQPQTYAQVTRSEDVTSALQAGADGVIYTEALGSDAQRAELKSAGQAVLRREDTP